MGNGNEELNSSKMLNDKVYSEIKGILNQINFKIRQKSFNQNTLEQIREKVQSFDKFFLSKIYTYSEEIDLIREENTLLKKLLKNQDNNLKRIVHDLKGCLASAFPAMEILKNNFNEPFTDLEKQDCLKCLDTGIRNMADILNDILPNRKSKTKLNNLLPKEITSNTQTLSLESVNIASIIDNVCTLCYPHIKKDNIAFDLSFKGMTAEKSDIISNKNYLLRIFSNLIANAVKFCDKDMGCIVIEVKNIAEKETVISIFNNGHSMTKQQVQDILNSPVEEIYIPQTSTLNQLKSSFIGHGIGLKAVRKMVRDLNGSFSIIQRGSGCEVIIKLPLLCLLKEKRD